MPLYVRAMSGFLHTLLALALRVPKHKPHPVAEDETHKLWYWIEDHGDVVFPLIGAAIIALVFFGIRRGMSTNVLELQKKQETKDAIVRLMRAKLLVSAETVAIDMKVDHFTAAALL